MSDLSAGIRLMNPAQMVLSRAHNWLIRAARKLPRLVWYDDEVDVVVTFTADKLPAMSADTPEQLAEEAMQELWSGPIAEIERNLSRLGIGFDKGMGLDGRDWEWDWSLRGPISVRFRRRSKNPHLRIGGKFPPEPPKPEAEE